ncbi:MAG: lipopolysaccharide biosynthesis protein [Nitrososphaerota archaeon]
MNGRPNSLLKGDLPQKQLVHLASVTGATVANNMAGFVAQMLGAKVLGPEEFGVFSLAFSVATLTAAIGDFGLNLTMIRLFNKYTGMPERQNILLGSVLGFKVLLFGFLALGSLLLGRFLALWLGIGPGATLLFAVALITGGLLFLWTYLEAYLQSHRLFMRLAGYLIAYAALRLGFLAVAHVFSPQQALIWLVATYTGPVLLLLVFGVLPKASKLLSSALVRPRQSLAFFKEALNYSKWVALSGIAYIAMPYVVKFVLATRASLGEVGIFSAGLTFTAAFTTLNTAVRAVLFPKVTAIEGQERTKEYLKRLGKIAPYYATVAAVGIAMLALLQGFVLGQAYRAAMPVFLVTASSAAITIFLGLGTMLVHTMMKPWIEAEVNALRFLTVTFIAYLVAPVLGALGIALAYSLTLVAGEAGIFCYILLKQKKNVAQ